MPIKVSIVEDNETTLKMLGAVINETPELVLLSSYSDSRVALERLPQDKPNVVLMDINMPEVTGIDCVRQLTPLLPKAQFLMLTAYEDTEHIFNALTAGATGYLLKSTRREDLIAGIRQIHEGGSPMSSGIARKVVRSFSQSPSVSASPRDLSLREKEVLDLLAQGYLYKEIADAMSLSMNTVSTYVRRIYEKLQVHSRNQAAAKYFSNSRQS